MIHSISLKKWILKAFVVVCFIGLLLPNISLFNEKENETIIRKENRKITEFPTFNLLQKEFYPKFENFYQDRLFGRDKLIYAWSILNYKCHVILKGNLIVGKHGWLFDKGASVKGFKDKEIKLKKIKDIQNWCAKNNVEFVLIVPPYKNAVYTDYLPHNIRVSSPDYSKIENDLIKSCQKLKINYISLYKPLLEGRKTFKNDIYWWDDHHWSYEGAAIAADTVLKYIKKQQPSFEYKGMKFDGTYRNGFKECSQVKSLGIANRLSGQTKVPWSKSFSNQIFGIEKKKKKRVEFINQPISNNYIQEKIVNGECLVYNSKTNNTFKSLFVCDSYAGYMTTYPSQFLPQMVNTHYSKKMGGKKDNTNLERLVKEYHPNLVILEINAPLFFHSKGVSVFNEIKY